MKTIFREMQRLWFIFAPELALLPTYDLQMEMIARDPDIGHAWREYHRLQQGEYRRTKRFLELCEQERRLDWERCSLGILTEKPVEAAA